MFQNHQRCFPFPFFLWRHFVIGILKPAAHKPLLPADKIDPTYRRLRWQVFAGIFFGYAAYYFVRGNFDLEPARRLVHRLCALR